MVKVKKQIIKDLSNTYGKGNPARYITIHETANHDKGAGAQTHADLQSNGYSATWHYQVDDKKAVQSFEHSVKCWHAGDGKGPGNTESIGIEICVNSDSNFEKAVENAAELTKKIMKQENIPAKNVVQHNHWSGKNCPAQLRSGKGVSWNDFKRMIEGKSDKPDKQPEKAKSISQMAEEVIAGKHGSGHANRRKSLGISKSEYEKVRAEVNRRLGAKSKESSKSGKSIEKMAKEVIAGKHGNGHEERRKSLGIDKETYEKVRAEVNKRAGVGDSSSKGKSSSKNTLKKGQTVTLKKSAKKFATGETIASFAKGKKYKILQVKSDRVLLDEIMSWVKKSDVQ